MSLHFSAHASREVMMMLLHQWLDSDPADRDSRIVHLRNDITIKVERFILPGQRGQEVQ
jgi:hypothetical protein